jgi:hypothetical protein
MESGGGTEIREIIFYLTILWIIYNGPTNALVCNKTLIQM